MFFLLAIKQCNMRLCNAMFWLVSDLSIMSHICYILFSWVSTSSLDNVTMAFDAGLFTRSLN